MASLFALRAGSAHLSRCAPDATCDAESGVATTSYGSVPRYDPLSRLIRTDSPDGTFATTQLGAWQETVADANDNVLASAWYADASTRPATDPLNRAASLAAADDDTPTTHVFDPLGRSFLSIADNGPGGMLPTRTALDIQGNALSVTDALGNVTVQQTPDALGRTLKRVSLDAGTSLALVDGGGHPYRAWDPRGFVHRYVYDLLRRPTQLWVTPPSGAEYLAQQTVYGEGLSQPNFRGHVYQQFDGAGVSTNAAYDFEGHVTHTTRQLASTYQTTPSWPMLATLTDPASFLPAAVSALESDVFDTLTTYDAMNRVVSVTAPDQSALVFAYNPSSFLGSVTAYVLGSATASPIVTAVTYNANGQRTSITYGQGVTSQYTYDDRTHVTVRIQTTRPSDGARLQDLNYTYDPVHNVVQVTDRAQQTVYFAGNVTSGTQLYAYDAIYRLTQATGREQPGQVGYALGPHGYPEAPLSTIPHRNDLQALLAYTEDYAYDGVGNLLSTAHAAAGAGWTRTQTYAAGSNRIATVSMPGDPANGPYSGAFQHDAAGNWSRMPNLTSMSWDHAGRLASADLGGGGTAYFTYDAGGQRVRKIIQRTGKLLERVYVGAYERYRERAGTSIAGGAVTLERHSLSASDAARRFVLIETKTLDASVPNLVPTPVFRFQCPNIVESACLETDAVGTPISYEEYYPYGGSSFRAGDVGKRYRYSGKERDEDTGLYYHGARYYAPWLGRWTAPDPAIAGLERDDASASRSNGSPGGPSTGGVAEGGAQHPTQRNGGGERESHEGRSYNLYEYVLGNPLAFTDPDGTAPIFIGHVYVVRGTLAGTPVVYTGSSAQELRARFSKHQWKSLVEANDTTIEVYKVYAEPKPEMSGRGTVRSATNEALRSPEQRVLEGVTEQANAEGTRVLNERRAASEENVTVFAERHNVQALSEKPEFVKLSGGRLLGRLASGANMILEPLALISLARELNRTTRMRTELVGFEDFLGKYTVSWHGGGLFSSKRDYYKHYTTGPVGLEVPISTEEFIRLDQEAKALWGYYDDDEQFVPGLLRRTAPYAGGPI